MWKFPTTNLFQGLLAVFIFWRVEIIRIVIICILPCQDPASKYHIQKLNGQHYGIHTLCAKCICNQRMNHQNCVENYITKQWWAYSQLHYNESNIKHFKSYAYPISNALQWKQHKTFQITEGLQSMKQHDNNSFL